MSRQLRSCPLVVLLAASACVDNGDFTLSDSTTADTTADEPGSSGASSGDDPTTGDPGTTAPPASETTDTTAAPETTAAPDTTAADGTTADPPDPDTTTTATTTTGVDTGDTGGTSDTGDDTTTGEPVEGGVIPMPSGACPDLIDGVVDFQPDGVNSPRAVRIWVDPDVAAEKDGPLVFYWHGTNGEPEQAISGLSDLGIQEILDAGGIVAAPTHDPGAGVFPWFLVLGQQQDDLLIADEILACAEQQHGVDDSRIHSLGFSAGGLHTAQMSIRRSSYLASVVTYSGGLIFNSMPTYDDPDNDFSAMLFHGGNSDVVVVGFKQASADYAAYIGDNGSFSFTCDHGMGHNIPPEQDSVLQFFADHPWGTAPEPYADELPNGFPGYCMLP
jgi:predicted esterase